MEKSSYNQIKGICTITELVKKLGLSRARFYQLQKTGVFPGPAYCIRTKRPFYTPYLQQKCLAIRETGIGYNGEPVIFNAPRSRKNLKIQDTADDKFQEFIEALSQTGHKVTPDMVKDALKVIFQEGIPENMDKGIISQKLYRYFQQRRKKGV